MTSGHFDLNGFMQQPDAVAVMVPAGELFGMLTRTFDLPPGWAALVLRKVGDDVVVRPGEMVSGDGAETVFFIHGEPEEIELVEGGIPTADKYRCEATVTLALAPMIERSELGSFRRRFMGSHRVVLAKDLVRHVQPAIRQALASFANDVETAPLVDGDASAQVSQAVAKALQAICFQSGLMVTSAPRIAFRSAALAAARAVDEKAAIAQREHEANRKLRAALRHSQQEHLEHLSGLLEKLQTMAQDSPDTQLPDLLRTFSDEQRGELYGALLAKPVAITSTRWVAVATSDELLLFAPGAFEEPARRVPIDGEAGPVRSVQCFADAAGRQVLWLGGSHGVYRLPVDAAGPDRVLLVKDAPDVRGGFNAVAVHGDQVVATHSELGIVSWLLGGGLAGELPEAVTLFASMTASARAVRGAEYFDGYFYCSVDEKGIAWPAVRGSGPGEAAAADSPERVFNGSRSTISAIEPSSTGLFAGNSEGDVLFWPSSRTDEPQTLHAGSRRAVESLCSQSTHGIHRLLFTDTTMYAHGKVIGDNFVSRYEAGGQTLRRIEAAEDMLVAMNEVRDRLLVFDPGDGSRPTHVVSIGAMAQRSVQDVCLVPTDAVTPEPA